MMRVVGRDLIETRSLEINDIEKFVIDHYPTVTLIFKKPKWVPGDYEFVMGMEHHTTQELSNALNREGL